MPRKFILYESTAYSQKISKCCIDCKIFRHIYQQQAACKLLPAGVIGQTVKHTVMALLRDPVLFLCNGGGHPALEYIPQKLPDKLDEAGIHE